MKMARPQVIKSRSRWIYGAFILAASLLGSRLLYLQVFQASRLTELAQQQHTQEVNLASVRGEIVDRNGKELAVSVEAASIYAQPADFALPPAEMAKQLGPVLQLDPAELEKILQSTHWRWIVRQLPVEVGKAIKALKIPGIGVIRESRRIYPKDTLAATLIGFVGIDNQGLAGIEHNYNKVLSGKLQQLHVQVDARGRELLRESNGSPLRSIQTDGARIILTLDETLQHIAQRELARSIEQLHAKRGAVLVMNAQTGDLLAFAVLPTFDPNHYQGVSWETIKNWVANDIYEPGSTMKVFTIAAALEAGKVSRHTVFDCGPTITIGGHTISDHEAPAGIRHLRPEDILEVSSNVGALQAGLRMPASFHRLMLQKFGFGESTQSGIRGESRGLLPKLPWQTMRQGSISFGYGLSVTPLQILTAATAIADDGRLHPPRLIDRVVGPDGKLLLSYPLATPSQVITPAISREVLSMLTTVVKSGTGTAARIPGYNVAGKTGTANKSRAQGLGYTSEVIASFLGFVPAEKPKLVVLALLDSPQDAHFASLTAAPLFQSVTRETLRYLGIQPYVPITSPEDPPGATR